MLFHALPERGVFPPRAIVTLFLLLCTCAANMGGVTPAQVTPPITSSGLNTQVSAPTNLPGGKVQYDITGGTRPGNGPNLFHSFGEFGVPTNNIANFLNDSSRATSNILGRVTGGNPSNIVGTIQTTGFGNANLFLMNPAGILFGPNATLNVGGSVHFTTADYLKLADNVRFNAIANATADALLSTAPVAAFGFLTSNPAAISIQGSALSVPPGESVSLVGGDISIQAGTLEDGTSQAAHLSAPGGQVRLASVASPGEVLHPTLDTGPNINGQTFTNMGTITISDNSIIDVSGDAAGTVIIHGGQLMVTDATISADTVNTSGAPLAVDINVTGDVSISDTRGVPAITARTTGSGDAGEVRIISTNLNATSSAEPVFALIDTHTSDAGKGGDVSITTSGNLDVARSSFGQMFFIDTGTTGSAGGSGGDVTIMAGNVRLQNAGISTGDFIAQTITNQEAAGSGGRIMLVVDTLQINNSVLTTQSFSGRAGDITISAGDIQLDNFSLLQQVSLNGTGNLAINANQLVMDSSQIDSETVFGQGGGVTITAKVVELKNGSTIQSQTFGDAPAGDIRVVATDHFTLSDDPTTLGARTRPSGLFTNSLGDPDFGTHGHAGSIGVITPQLVMSGGARIDTTTQTNGRGGDVTITATNSVTITGQRITPVVEVGLFDLGSSLPSGIFTRTVGSDLCSGPCGDAGRVSITTGSLNLSGGAAINSGTTSTGRGGDITVTATGPISISGTLSDGTPSGIFSRTVDAATGAGGTITLKANQVSLSAGSAISAQSTSIGEAGNINIHAIDSFVSRNSAITTSTTQSDGGNITIQAGNLVQLNHSEITTSVQGGAGHGGNINIDPPVVIVDSSKIIASAVGGDGGSINIVAGIFLVSPDSIIDASSTFGVSGTINIESPITNLSGTLAPLPGEIVQVAALLRAACAARFQGGNSSSFVVAGRDGMPLEPGGPLTIPLFAANTGSTRLAGSLNLPGLRVGRTFGDPDLALTALNMGCAS